MARYVDGFILSIPKKNLDAYRRMAQKASKSWREHGALEYRACVGADLNVKMALPFPKGIKSKPGETVVFASIAYKSSAHQDAVNFKVMKDPRISGMRAAKEMPLDRNQMLYGGFESILPT